MIKVASVDKDGVLTPKGYDSLTGWMTEYGNLHLVDQSGAIKVTYAHGFWHHCAGENGASGSLSPVPATPAASAYPRRSAGGAPNKSKAMTAAARAAWPDESQYPTCQAHGDTLDAKFKAQANKGRPFLSCWKKEGEGYCQSVVWNLPDAVAKAIVEAAA